ncbi:MAG: hypothetical protein R3D84_09740 [Paracoccaceae bacterium]
MTDNAWSLAISWKLRPAMTSLNITYAFAMLAIKVSQQQVNEDMGCPRRRGTDVVIPRFFWMFGQNTVCTVEKSNGFDLIPYDCHRSATGHEPSEKVPSMGCSIKWKETP